MRIRLDLAYDGTGIAGWQIQPDHPTVQRHLEDALGRVYRRRVRVAGASRTDSGVHALQQVAHFDTDPDDPAIPPEKVRAAVQPWLPPQVVVLRSCEMPADWHSIASVTSKRYRYLIRNDRVPHPLLDRISWQVKPRLDLPAMQQAATALVGRHDFAAFETTGAPRSSTVRTILDLSLEQIAPWTPLHPPTLPGYEPGPLIAFEIEGDGFLYNMVRAITGTLVNVGKGKWTPERVAAIRESADRTQAGETAPACGLWLVRVHYGNHDNAGDG